MTETLFERAVESVLIRDIKPEIYTYLIIDSLGHGKIGKSFQPKQRLRDLQASSPVVLTLYAVMKGDHEYKLHNNFTHLRLHGEWFKVDEQLLAEFHAHRISETIEVIVEETNEYNIIVDEDDGSSSCFSCPRCPKSRAHVVEMFFDDSGEQGSNSLERFLRIILQGTECSHTFEVSISLTDEAYLYHRFIHKPMFRRRVV